MCSVALCPLQSSTVCPTSVSASHCTVYWFCVTMSTAVFYSLSNVCQYLRLYRMLVPCHYVHCCLLKFSTVCQYLTLYSILVLCHYAHCCLLQSVQCLSVTHTVQSVGSVSLCRLQFSKVCPLSVSTSHSTVRWFCVIMSTAVFYSFSKICQYLTLKVCWFCVTMSTDVFYSLSTVYQYLTLYSKLVLCHYINCSLLQFFHRLSVPHTVKFLGSVSLRPMLSSTFCPNPISTTQFTACWVWVNMPTVVFYNLSTVCQYLTLYNTYNLCQYVHCCLLKLFHYLSVPHTVQSLGSVSLCPLLSSTFCPMSVSTTQFTASSVWVTMSTAVFYNLSTVCQYLTMYCFCSVSLCPLLSSIVCPR